MAQQQTAEQFWRGMLTGEAHGLRRERRLLALLPSNPRCKICNSPFGGIGGPLMRLLGKRPSASNPRFCDICSSKVSCNVGGAEVEMTLLFADVRGSTTLAERMTPKQFSDLMTRFYNVATKAIIDADGFVDKLVGDAVVAIFVSGFAGPAYSQRAVEAAVRLLRGTGHADSSGPWIPIGVGINTGLTYMGTVGSRDTFSDVTVLGDAVNVAARLGSAARTGEILVSEATVARAKAPTLAGLERRSLELKGKMGTVDARVLRVGVIA